MAYSKVGPWSNGGAPALSEANLDTMETQYEEAVTEAAVLIAAIPEDGAAGVASERTLGSGAVQAAAGDHGHGTQFDDQDEDTSTQVADETKKIYKEAGATIGSGIWTVLLTKVITLAADGEVHGYAAGASRIHSNAAGSSLELFIDGVEVADSGGVWSNITDYFLITVMGHRACSAGNITVELKHHNTSGGAGITVEHCMGLFAGVSKVS